LETKIRKIYLLQTIPTDKSAHLDLCTANLHYIDQVLTSVKFLCAACRNSLHVPVSNNNIFIKNIVLVNLFVCSGFFVDTSIHVFTTSLLTQGHHNEFQKVYCLFKYFPNSCGLPRKTICLVFRNTFFADARLGEHSTEKKVEVARRKCVVSFCLLFEGGEGSLPTHIQRICCQKNATIQQLSNLCELHPLPYSTSHRQYHQVLYNNPS